MYMLNGKVIIIILSSDYTLTMLRTKNSVYMGLNSDIEDVEKC